MNNKQLIAARPQAHLLLLAVKALLIRQNTHCVHWLAIGRKSIKAGESYQLRESAVPYSAHFGGKNVDIESENTYFWND
jgi:hypothetical protein